MRSLYVILAGLLFAGPVLADGFYAGGAIGFGTAEFQPDDSGIVTIDDDDRVGAIKGFGGYRANSWIAFEIGLIGAANGDEDFDAEVTFGAFTASILGILPLGERAELFARLGGYVGESEVEAPATVSRSEDDEGLNWGVGAFVNLGSRKQFTIRMEYEQFDMDDAQGFDNNGVI